MSVKKIDLEDLKAALLKGEPMRAYARRVGVHESSIRGAKKRLANKGWSPEHDMTHEVPDGYTVKGVSTLYNQSGQVKAQWVKSSVDEARRHDLFKEALEAMKEELPRVEPSKALTDDEVNQNLMVVYPLGDPHIGMVSWAPETGQNWDLQYAETVLCEVFKRAVLSSPKCHTAVIVNLGDFFHYDNMEGTTSRSGNRLDVDGRYAKMVRVGVKVIRQMITTALEHHQNVRIINVIGNHDDTGALFLSVCLAHIYENDPRVSVDDSPAPYHFVRFGTTLIGTHHGHTCKMEKLPSIMAAALPKEWGETKFRYWLTGHIHQDSKKEFPGCMVESFRTMAPADAFAAWHGYHSGRDTKVIVYHRTRGEVQRNTIAVVPLDEEETNE